MATGGLTMLTEYPVDDNNILRRSSGRITPIYVPILSEPPELPEHPPLTESLNRRRTQNMEAKLSKCVEELAMLKSQVDNLQNDLHEVKLKLLDAEKEAAAKEKILARIKERNEFNKQKYRELVSRTRLRSGTI